jgi:hypothetical protein
MTVQRPMVDDVQITAWNVRLHIPRAIRERDWSVC